MKKLLILLAGVLATACANAAGPSFGQHGMALFGTRDAIYAAHLPMFHAPHDAQVVLQLHLADPALDRALRARLARGPVLWTLAPENFELDRYAETGKTAYPGFRADVVRGHFEQGGKTCYPNARVLVDRVLYYRKLVATPAVAATARYFQVGAGEHRFLVKEIDSRPDFDHIVAMTMRSTTPHDGVVVAKRGMQQPTAQAFIQTLPGARVAGTVYFGTEDLR